MSLLFRAERTVGEMERRLRLSQPLISHHLMTLRAAGFVEKRAEGTLRYYRLRLQPFQELDAWLTPFRRLWSKDARALDRELDALEKARSKKRQQKKKEKPSVAPPTQAKRPRAPRKAPVKRTRKRA